MGRLILVLWPLALMDILFHVPAIAIAASAVFFLYLAASLAGSSLMNQLLAGAIALAALLVALEDGAPLSLASAFTHTLVFAAFVPSAQLLRTVAESDPRVLSFRDRLQATDPRARPAWLLVGANVLGSVLAIGSVAILSPVFADPVDATARREDAVSAVAGTALALTWSPFFVALAVVASFLPDVPLWQVILVGIALSAAGILLALLMLRTPAPLRTALAALVALRDFVPLVLVAGAAVVLLRSVSPLSSLEAACLAIPVLCLMLVLSRAEAAGRRRAAGRALFAATAARITNIGADVAIVALAFTLGLVLRESPAVAELIAASGLNALSPLAILFLVPLSMIAASMLCVHPIVSASIMLAVFAGRHPGLADVVLVGAVLVGWSASAMVAFSGLLLMVTMSFGGLTRGQLILGRNMIFAPAFASLGALLLNALNMTIATY
ncbi:hypothetical protein E0K89_000110 [Aquicoccus sp. SCR17]|nr:hypothetical protein [Carideicomes alvinocaridis]